MKSTRYQAGNSVLIELIFTCLLCLGLIAWGSYRHGGLPAMWTALVTFILGVPLALIVVGFLYEIISSNRLKAEICEIEKSYPQARITRLSNGNWLITSKVTGETINEIKRKSGFFST